VRPRDSFGSHPRFNLQKNCLVRVDLRNPLRTKHVSKSYWRVFRPNEHEWLPKKIVCPYQIELALGCFTPETKDVIFEGVWRSRNGRQKEPERRKAMPEAQAQRRRPKGYPFVRERSSCEFAFHQIIQSIDGFGRQWHPIPKAKNPAFASTPATSAERLLPPLLPCRREELCAECPRGPRQ
jgi:hypothetical protein